MMNVDPMGTCYTGVSGNPLAQDFASMMPNLPGLQYSQPATPSYAAPITGPMWPGNRLSARNVPRVDPPSISTSPSNVSGGASQRGQAGPSTVANLLASRPLATTAPEQFSLLPGASTDPFHMQLDVLPDQSNRLSTVFDSGVLDDPLTIAGVPTIVNPLPSFGDMQKRVDDSGSTYYIHYDPAQQRHVLYDSRYNEGRLHTGQYGTTFRRNDVNYTILEGPFSGALAVDAVATVVGGKVIQVGSKLLAPVFKPVVSRVFSPITRFLKPTANIADDAAGFAARHVDDTAQVGRSAAPSSTVFKRGVWDWDPKIRGRAIEKRLGGNLPSNYPTIDRFQNGIATSIKSMDLGAPTYAQPRAITRVGQGHIDKVAGFQGKWWAGKRISASEIGGRALDLAVPRGAAATPAQREALQGLVEYGSHRGVTVNILEIQ